MASRIPKEKSDYLEFDHQYDHLPVYSEKSAGSRTSSAYSLGSSQKRPLIDYVTNEWRSHPKYKDEAWSDTGSEPDWKEPRIVQVLRAPKVKRLLAVVCTVLLLLNLTWKAWIKPRMEEQRALDDSLRNATARPEVRYGQNMRPAFKDMIHVGDMDSRCLPGSKERPHGRLVIVGDVHGCKHELTHLLEKVKFNKHKDHLILTGDIINKGPDSPGVVDLARDLGASCVRGNHEDKTLLAYAHKHSGHVKVTDSQDPLPQEVPSMGSEKIQKLVASLNKEQIEWLKTCPVILRVGEISGMGEVLVVHAGLAPGVSLNKQDPFQVMNMRTIDLLTRVPSENRDGMAWEKVWNHYQVHQHKNKRQTVVYGHDSKRGLQINEYAKGLDTGCVKGGQLTALVIEAGDGKETKQELVHVKANKDYTA